MCRIKESTVLIQNGAIGDCILQLSCPAMVFASDPQWWFNFIYRVNKDRGISHAEDLWAPGLFKGHIESPGRVVFSAHLGGCGEPEPTAQVDADAIKEDLLRHQEQLMQHAGATEKTDKTLCLAADQFVASAGAPPASASTIVAGFPGSPIGAGIRSSRCPDCCLATGRHEEAGSVLHTFAAAIDEGMIPNRFDDRTGEAHFNSVDASLWFVHAAFEYLDATGEIDEFAQGLLPALRAIIDAYHSGTHFGIHADSDGLIAAGDASTQLTWMDAKCDDVVFTPRHGKAVEVNALWHNALRRMRSSARSRSRWKPAAMR